jgi:HK97 family phage major capsid protein
MPTPDQSDVTRLLDKREQARSACERLLLEARAQGRETLNTGEADRLKIAQATMRDLDDQIVETRAEIERAGLGSPLLARLSRNQTTLRSTMNEPIAYRRSGGPSYLRDMVRVAAGIDDTSESRNRLAMHAEQVASHPDYLELRDLSRVDGSGGYAVPPAWLMSQYIELARPGRAIANLIQRQPLPGGTDSINIPKVLSGTAVGVQTADNVPATDVDLTDTFINAPVRTISGQQGVAIQLIDQSPIAFDDVIFRDLTAAFATSVDLQVISGTGSSGQILGILGTPNIGTVAVSTIDIQGVYSAIANAIQLVHTTRFLPPEVIVMHPRRWGWLQSLLDLQQRPLFLPLANNPMNAGGIVTDVASQQVVGNMLGLPVVTDPNLPINLGSGTEDPVLVMRASDIVLWEGGIRARVLPEPKAQNLTVILQIYGYLAFSAARYPQSIVQITGLTAPTF